MDGELKFRVWDIADKCWVNPNLLEVWDDSGKLEPFQYVKTGTLNPLYTPVENYVIQQFTDLKDKNGKEIYEGDVLSFRNETYKVKYRSGCFMLDNINNGQCGKDGSDIWDTHVWHTLFDWKFQLEIIGNILENIQY